MNRRFILFSFIAMLYFAINIYSQPMISYIIPDIGAPGMNIYVEFVAPYDARGTFGADGFYFNNPGDNDNVKVIVVNSGDNDKIKIGPLLVSWDGRLISTHIFVHPGQNPNSTDALTLNPEFKIPIGVQVNGILSNIQTFYIVRSRPYFNGNDYPSETVFGEGTLGSRSPRGAMIFDSLDLANSTYTISKTDCDPNTDGNQGYLPFTLLVKGRLHGDGATLISADGFERNGGPGGGGGGGRFYDAFLFGGGANGDNGGDGYVGGGAGGRNRNNFSNISDSHRNPGAGSGINGHSLNGIPFPQNQAYESAAGGTGHPFGLSGQSCGDGSNCAPEGAYGAGSGVSQNRHGGSAGYGSNGWGVGPSGGKVHGNRMNIPIAGGSGGASGNPNFPDSYSGSGGGGGGAMSISASDIKTIRFSAKGADGGNRSGGIGNSAFGGSGSGGAFNLLSKGTVEDIRMYLDGGIQNDRRAGHGRHRIDGEIVGTRVILETEDPDFSYSAYLGISTDTTQFVKRNFRLTGTQALPGKNTRSQFYIADFKGNWMLLPTMGFVDPAFGKWASNMSMINGAEIMCLVMTQDVPSRVEGDYEHEPIRVMSQAGANMFILDLNPILVADSTAENMAITCIGYERFVTTVIKNDESAGGNLEFNINNNNWIFGNNGFEVIEPLGNIVIEPGDSIILKVRYYWEGGDKVNIMNRFYFNHNDPAQKNPWMIDFRVGDAYQPRMGYVGSAEDFIFPDTRIGGKSSRNITLRNTGESDLLIEEIEPIDPPFYVMGTDVELPKVLKPGEEIRIWVEFRPTSEDSFIDGLITNSKVTDTTCANFAFQNLEGKGVFSSVDVNVTEIDFGLVPWCDEQEQLILISNPASATASFSLKSLAELIGDNPEAFEITNNKNPDIVLTPDTRVQYNIRINGKLAGTGVKTAKFIVTTDVPETPFIEVILKAEIVGFDVVSDPPVIDLGRVDIGFDFDETVTLINNARLPERLKSLRTTNEGSFSFPIVEGDIVTPNGGKYDIEYNFNSSNQSQNNQLVIAFDDPCEDTLYIPITVDYIIAKESAIFESRVLLDDINKIDTIDFGRFSSCQDDLPKFINFTNFSEGRYVVLDEQIVFSGTEIFLISARGLSYPDTLYPSPATKSGAQILFDPRNKPEGEYYADYVISIYINGEYINRKIVLRGEVVDGDFEAIPNNINLSAVVGLSDSGELTFKNSGPYDIEILSVATPSLDIFKLNELLTGIIVPANNEIKFNIDFLPDNVGLFLDSIIIRILIAGCEKEITYIINGEGLPSKKLIISIPDITVEPTLNNFRIPILAKLEKENDELGGFEIESIKVTMRRNIFYPKSIISGNLISSSLDGENRTIEFSIQNINANDNNSVIAEIEGATLLGDADFSDIIISDIKYSQTTLVGQITSLDGTIKTEICSEGGDRLLRQSASGNSISINPNPVTDRIIITSNTLEKGTYIFEIIDLLGNKIYQSNFINEAINNQITIEKSTEDIPSGNYIINMTTPTEQISLPFIILK